MKSWKTTLGGTLLGIGTLMMQSSDPVTHAGGVLCTALGGLFLGISAKDYNVTGGTKQQ